MHGLTTIPTAQTRMARSSYVGAIAVALRVPACSIRAATLALATAAIRSASFCQACEKVENKYTGTK